MSDSFQKRLFSTLPQLFTAIGVITALASLSTMNLGIAAASSALIVISVLVILLPALKRRYGRNTALEILDVSIEPHSELEVRHIRNMAELKEKSNLDLECYGEHVIDFEGLKMWWGRYPDGSYELFKGSRLIGSIDIWPIPKRTFDLFVAGKLKERDFREDDICQKGEKHMYWYLGDIIIEKAQRRFGGQGRLGQYEMLRRFIEETMEQWLSNTQELSDNLELCAIVASPQGKNLLKKFGFHTNGNESPDKLSIYIRTTSISEIRRDIQLIFKSPKGVS